MTDYILKVNCWDVVGGRHYYGRVEGPNPPSCHGNLHFQGGRKTCDAGHEIPNRLEWDIQQVWTAEDYMRYHKRQFEPPSPEQFFSKEDLLRVAAQRFTGEIIDEPVDEVHLPDGVRPGDKLWYGWVARPQDADLTDDDGWGKCIAVRTPDWWTPRQVADYLKISDGTLLYWARKGYIQYKRKERGWRFYPRDEVMRLKRDHKPSQRFAPR